MNFANALSKIHRKEFSWERVAVGFLSREQVADQLGCAPENVRQKLAVGLRLGHFEAKQFKVWDAATERFIYKEGYRIITGTPAPSGSCPQSPVSGTPSVGSRVISRHGTPGTIKAKKGATLTIEWKSGRVTQTTQRAFDKCDINLV